MLLAQQINAYYQYGFLLIPNLLEQSDILALRQAVEACFKEPPGLPGDAWFRRGLPSQREAKIRWLFEHPLIRSSLSSLLGIDYYAPKESLFAHQAFESRWHRDTDYYDMSSQTFHLEPDFLMVNVICYLQDNSPVGGGGLDVLPGSHRYSYPDQYLNPHDLAKSYTIPSQAGDVIFFDQRILHRATPPQTAPDSAVASPPKLTLIWTASANNRHVDYYYQFMKLPRPS